MIYGIQVLRGLAAVLVVCRHIAKEIASRPERGFAVGQVGVDIFFVISGVVIYLTGRKLDWNTFFKRRVARIVPLYWFALLVTLLGDIVKGNSGGEAWISNALFSFFFLPSRGDGGSVFPPLVVGWTLNYEMWFYLAATGVLLLGSNVKFLRNLSVFILGAILVGLIMLSLHNWEIFAPFVVMLMPISVEFLAGVWLAYFWDTGYKTPRWLCGALLAISITWFALAPAADPFTVWRPLAWGIPAILVVWVTLNLERYIDFGKFRFALLLGDSSYALYLVHPIVLGVAFVVVHKLIPEFPNIPLFVILAATCIFVGIIVHLCIEKPALRIANRVLGLQKKNSLTHSSMLKNRK